MKKQVDKKRLVLAKEQIRQLEDRQLPQVAGGGTATSVDDFCTKGVS